MNIERLKPEKDLPTIRKALRLDGKIYAADNHALAFAALVQDNPDFAPDEDMHLIDYGFINTTDEFIFADDYVKSKKIHE